MALDDLEANIDALIEEVTSGGPQPDVSDQGRSVSMGSYLRTLIDSRIALAKLNPRVGVVWLGTERTDEEEVG